MQFINKKTAVLAIVCLLTIAVLMVNYERKIDHQKKHIELLEDELRDEQSKKEFYQEEYKKYFELSEELQNQMGVYSYD